MAQNCPKRQPCKNCGGDHSNRNCKVPKKPQTRGNLSSYPTKQAVKPDTIEEANEEDDDVDEQGFSINETNTTVQNSWVTAQSLPGVPMDKLQEDIMIE